MVKSALTSSTVFEGCFRRWRHCHHFGRYCSRTQGGPAASRRSEAGQCVFSWRFPSSSDKFIVAPVHGVTASRSAAAFAAQILRAGHILHGQAQRIKQGDLFLTAPPRDAPAIRRPENPQCAPDRSAPPAGDQIFAALLSHGFHLVGVQSLDLATRALVTSRVVGVKAPTALIMGPRSDPSGPSGYGSRLGVTVQMM